jgi:hypothetical protein
MSAMWSGEPAAGLVFYEFLRADDEFCVELGRAVLAAGRLESALVGYLQQQEPDLRTAKATLGTLIRYAEDRTLLSNLVPALRTLSMQRNYLAHSLHALFSGLVEESILPRNGLVDSDVSLFRERAWQLRQDLDDLAAMVERQVRPLPSLSLQPPSGAKFRE